eukprot:6508057-Alexandrium_andersonii.AAC.1
MLPPRDPFRLVQPPRPGAINTGPQNFNIGGGSSAPGTPNTYRAEQGVWNAPESRFETPVGHHRLR